jgi:hypothetical protein
MKSHLESPGTSLANDRPLAANAGEHPSSN